MVKGEISSITKLAATTTALTAVESEIPNVSNLVKKIDYITKSSEAEKKIDHDKYEHATDHDQDKYIINQEFNTLTSKNFTVRLKQVNSATKNDTADFLQKDRF